VLRGFADDSGSGKGSKQGNVFVLAGFISTADKWERFSNDWEEVCDRDPKTPDFHMVEAYRIKGRYHWKDEATRDAKIRELVNIITARADYRVDAVVGRPNYDQIVRGRLPKEIDDPYFICFYSVILGTAHLLNKLGVDGKVHWIFDEQGPIGIEAVRWYAWIRDSVPPEVAARLGSTPMFEDDNKILPLKAADILAWQFRRHLNEEQPVGIPYTDNVDSLLSLRGVSCQIRPEHLEALVQSEGLNLQAGCRYYLEPGVPQ
jgi:hypothetical protein